MTYTHCPSCNVPWQEEQTIYEHLREMELYTDKTDDEVRKMALSFGDTPENPKHFGVNCLFTEVQGMYDGALYIQCTNCNHRVGRFSGKSITCQDALQREADYAHGRIPLPTP